MKVDNVLILAAGKGTRMGEIGKVIPKVIWPLFNKSILELEVAYARQFSPRNIFINLYNSKDKVKAFVENKKAFDDVTFIEEKEVLDIGGAVHNLASKLNYEGSLLIINSDQFIILSKEKIKEFETKTKSSKATLLVYSVDPQAGYGGLQIKSDEVVGLINKKDSKFKEKLITYTGMSCIQLNMLKRKEGESRFFDSVIDFEEVIPNYVNVDSCEYWDFGTLKRYKDSIEKIKNSKDEFKKFLVESGVIFSKSSKINESLSLYKNKIILKT